jgi:hypothetical protein
MYKTGYYHIKKLQASIDLFVSVNSGLKIELVDRLTLSNGSVVARAQCEKEYVIWTLSGYISQGYV